MKNLIFFLLIFISGNIFANEGSTILDASCTAKEFQSVKLKQNCILNRGQDSSCLLNTMADAMQGLPVAKANLAALTADLPEDLRVRLNRVIETVQKLSRAGSRVPISEGLRNKKAISDESPRAWDKVTSFDRIQQIAHQALREQFPLELDRLEMLNDEYLKELNLSRQAYETRVGRSDSMYSSWDRDYWNNGQRDLETSIAKKHNQKKAELLQSNPKLRLVNQLIEGAGAFEKTLNSTVVATTLTNIANDKNVEEAVAREAKRYQFIDDRYPLSLEKAASNASIDKLTTSRFGMNVRAATGGAAAFGLGLFGGTVFEKIGDRSRLNNCREHFGFSNSEMDYLRDRSFFSLRVKTSKECKDFGFFTEDPMSEYKSLLKKFNGVPSGICKMVKGQLERLNNLSPEVKISKSSCLSGDISGNGFKILTTDSSTRMIQISTSTSQEYSIPWNDKILYPDFVIAAKFGDSSLESVTRQKKLGELAADRLIKYGDASGGTYVFSPEDDLLSPCSDKPFYCEIRQRASSARIALIQQRQICEQVIQPITTGRASKRTADQ